MLAVVLFADRCREGNIAAADVVDAMLKGSSRDVKIDDRTILGNRSFFFLGRNLNCRVWVLSYLLLLWFDALGRSDSVGPKEK